MDDYRNRGGWGSETRGVGELEYRKLRTALCPLSHAVDHHDDVFMAVSSHTPISVVSKNQHPGSAFRDCGSKVCRVHTVALRLGYRRGDSVLTVALTLGYRRGDSVLTVALTLGYRRGDLSLIHI